MDTSLTIRVSTNWSGPNRPGIPMTPLLVCIHETANLNTGANAEMHRRFVQGGGGAGGVSFHYCVDDTEAVQLLTDTEVGWHAGDGSNGPGNRTAIAIETCVNSDGDFARTRHNLAILTAQLLHKHGLALDAVRQHHDFSGKNCPTIMRTQGLWAGQLAATKVAYEAMAQTETASPFLRAWAAMWEAA